MSLNTAEINGIAQQYGLSLTPDQLQYVQNNSQGGDNSQLVIQALQQLPQYQQQVQGSATAAYNAQQGSAISTLQTGKTNLAGQYSDLLKTVTGEYQPLIDQATLQQNAQNASRGLVSNAGNGGTQMLSALNPIYSAQAANAQQLGQGSIADMNAYNQAISAAQQGQATTNLSIPLEYGSLQMNQSALPSQIALAQAQAGLAGAQAKAAPFISTGLNGILFNSGNGQANLLGQNLSSNAIANALKALGI